MKLNIFSIFITDQITNGNLNIAKSLTKLSSVNSVRVKVLDFFYSSKTETSTQ
jgi:hypothetical protein